MHWKNLEDRNDTEQKPECRLEATGLVKTMDNLETGIMVAIWHEILQRFNTVSLMLQDSQLDLNSTISLFHSVIESIALQRSRFSFFEQTGKELTDNETYHEGTRRKRNTQMKDYVLNDVPGIPENSTVQTPADRFRVDSFLPIVDKLVSALTNRRAAYSSAFCGGSQL